MFKSSISVSPYSIARFLNFVLKNKKQKVLSHWYMRWRRGIGNLDYNIVSFLPFTIGWLSSSLCFPSTDRRRWPYNFACTNFATLQEGSIGESKNHSHIVRAWKRGQLHSGRNKFEAVIAFQLHDPKKVSWNWRLTFIECPMIKHLILSPDSLWRFCPRPVHEKCR